MNNRITRTAAALLCLCFLLVVAFSHAFIAESANHVCTGEHCVVCQAQRRCASETELLGSALVTFALIAVLVLLTVKKVLLYISERENASPVFLRVKLTE